MKDQDKPAVAKPDTIQKCYDDYGKRTTDLVILHDAGLTKLEYACIQLKVAKTDKAWLDDLILESRKNELAGIAMAGLMLRFEEKGFCDIDMCGAAYDIADAMIKAGNNED